MACDRVISPKTLWDRANKKCHLLTNLCIKLNDFSSLFRNINFKQILVTDDRSKAYLGFETDKHAKNYVDNATLTNPDISTHPKVISNLPLQNLKPPSPPIERKVLIENVPLDWPGAPSIHRMLKKNKIEYKDVKFEVQKRHALVILFDQQNVDRTLMIVHRVGLNMSASIV